MTECLSLLGTGLFVVLTVVLLFFRWFLSETDTDQWHPLSDPSDLVYLRANQGESTAGVIIMAILKQNSNSIRLTT